jgi:hypothetical protein
MNSSETLAGSPPDPLTSLISELLSMDGMHPDTALLIRLAAEAQETGRLKNKMESR